MPTQWFVRREDEIYGPFTSGKLREYALSGRLLTHDEVSKDGIKWYKATKVQGLTFGTSSAATEAQCQQAVTVGRETSSSNDSQAYCTREMQESNDAGLGGVHVSPDRGVGKPSVSASTDAEPLTPEMKRILLFGFVIVPYLLPTFGAAPARTGVWILACASLVIGWVVFYLFCEPHERHSQIALGAFFFTAVVGVTALIIFQEVATSIVETEVPFSRHAILAYVIKWIGIAYLNTFSGMSGQFEGGFWKLLVSTIFSVGLCEELIKLIPVIWAIRNDKSLTFQSAIFVGAMSGLGFGVTEGLYYSFTVYESAEVPLSMYLTRFFGCAFGHAVLSIMASVVLFAIREDGRPRDGVPYELPLLGWSICALVSAVPHGLSNTFLNYHMCGLAGLVDGVVVWIVAGIVNVELSANKR